jgi:biofilm PGA synthesis N-glycosyltransferase PgaC
MIETFLHGFGEFPVGGFTHAISSFIFYYPLMMSYVWMIGAIICYLMWERKAGDTEDDMPVLQQYPPVSILVPCHNEGENIRDTLEFLLRQRYPNFEIVAIDDGSADKTLEILLAMAARHPQIRVVRLDANQGKAMALRTGALLTKNEFLVCIDGDALLGPEAVAWMMRQFQNNPKLGAVTGNPRIRTRSTLLGKIQVGEFSAIVGLIKRAQQVYGRIFTVSGVIAGFRKSALHSVGYWSIDMVTEDIDISWKLQLNGWDIQFEPNALCWVLMPESLPGLWKQRLRWSQGGAEVLLRHTDKVLHWNSRRMWPIWLECLVSIVWSYLMVAGLAVWGVSQLFELHRHIISRLIPNWTGMILSFTCLAQFGVSLAIDSRYERKFGGIGRYYYWMIWYPLVYWINNVLTTVVGLLKAIAKKRGQRAVWVTSDRGVLKRDRTGH